MALIVRYITIKNSIAQANKSFLTFFPLSGKTGAEISQSILEELELNNSDVMMCRGQGYDNASTMSGIHDGVQQTIKNINPKALFVPCGNYTLSLAGVHAVGSSIFAVLEELYAFLLPVALVYLSNTRQISQQIVFEQFNSQREKRRFL